MIFRTPCLLKKTQFEMIIFSPLLIKGKMDLRKCSEHKELS